MYFKTLLLSFILVSCANNPIKRWNISAPDYNDAMAVLHVYLDDNNHLGAGKTCELYLINEKGVEASLDLISGDNFLTFKTSPELSHNKWHFSHLSCGLFSKFKFVGTEPFIMEKAKFSFLGKLELKIESKKMVTIETPQLEYEEYKLKYITLPDEIKMRLIHGYTGKELHEHHFGQYAETEVHLEGKDVRGVKFPLEKCLKLEKAISPFFIGPSKLVATFNTRGVMAILTTPKKLAVSDAMYSCLVEELRKVSKSKIRDSKIELTW